MTFKLHCPNVFNFGDFLNCLPVVSGLHKAVGEKIKFVIPQQLSVIKGIREFLLYQGIFETVNFRNEMILFDEASWYVTTYHPNEFRDLTERPNRPIETLRHEQFIREKYPDLDFDVDDNFELQVRLDYGVQCDQRKIIVGDRWSKVTDTRRSWNILKNSGYFDDEKKFQFLDYNEDVMVNALRIKSSMHPFIGTFTGSGMMADLMKKENYVVWDDSMINWNNAPIEYSYWKHYFFNRNNHLIELHDPNITGAYIT